jgi:hypothetical protein
MSVLGLLGVAHPLTKEKGRSFWCLGTEIFSKMNSFPSKAKRGLNCDLIIFWDFCLISYFNSEVLI